MQTIILGSGSPLPDPERAGPSTLVRTRPVTCCSTAAAACSCAPPRPASSAGALRALFLTHLHSDHTTDLNDIVTSRWVTSFQPNPLTSSGHPERRRSCEATEAMLELDIGYRLAHHADLHWRPSTDVVEHERGQVWAEGPSGSPLRPPTTHRCAPPSGYRVDEDGSSVVIAGDTVPCAGLDELCAGADMLVHTVVRRDLIEPIGLPRLTDVLDYHSTVEDAARTAARNGVGTLVLTHLVPAPRPEAEHEWAALAGEHFDGMVVVAQDLLALDVGGPGD